MPELSVKGVYLYFEALKSANALESFFTECETQHLTLEVSDKLYDFGKTQFERLSAAGGGVRPNAVGPKCPACPDPPRL